MDDSVTLAYINDIAKRLHDPSKYGSASVMVGAGFSKNATTLSENKRAPDWEELASRMYELLYPKSNKCTTDSEKNEKWEKGLIKKTSGKNTLKLAEEFKIGFGRNKLDSFIEEMIDDEAYAPDDLHTDLLKLNWDDVFTTNYDTLLERATKEILIRKNYKVVKSQKDLPGSTHPRIIKLHGSIPDTKPYIICEEDYRTYPTYFAPFVNTVQQSMLETQLCLIGFSGDDPNFLSWLGWLRDNMGENTPKIYLCGIFNLMSEYEKKMLESQNIVIVNLEALIKKESTNRYYESLKEFLRILSDYGKKPNLFKDVPTIYFNSKVDNEYYSKMIAVTEKIKFKISNYIAIPFDYAESIQNKFSDHFDRVLREENNIQKYELIYNLVSLLRKGYVPLLDEQAEAIQLMLEELSFEEIKLHIKGYNIEQMWFELNIYIAEMYRIDSIKDKFLDKMKLIKDNFKYLDLNAKNEYFIEFSKYYISEFDYAEAVESIKKINESTSLEVQIKKSCLLSQVQLVEEAQDLLKKSSSSLAQRHYTEDKTAALTSYINLCARSLSIGIRDMEAYSDKDYFDNEYNIRVILNNYKDNFNNSFMNKDYNRRGKLPGFNPNSHRYRYGTSSKEEIELRNNAFSYVLLQDSLCLPIYRDHKLQIKRACIELIKTSKNPFWKWSYIIRLDDDKLIDNFLSRERVFKSQTSLARNIFNNLLNLLKQHEKDDFNTRKIINQKMIYDILSRMCIVLDIDNVLQVFNVIYDVLPNLNEITQKIIKKALNRISYIFDSNLLEQNITKILTDSTPNNIYLANYFQRVYLDNMKSYITEGIINNIVEEIDSSNILIRDKGLSKLLMLKRNDVTNIFNEEITRAIWSQLDKFNFPKTNIFTTLIWEDLTPEYNEIKGLYKNYLYNPHFIRCVNKNGVSISVNTDASIDSYINQFYTLSVFNQQRTIEIDWSPKAINKILNYILEYIENERELVDQNFSLFREDIPAKERFSKLGELTSYIATHAKADGICDNETYQLVDKIKGILESLQISTMAIDTFFELEKDNSRIGYEKVMQQIIRGSSDKLSQAFASLELISVYKENVDNSINIKDKLKELVSALKYMDIRVSKRIFIYLSTIITRKIFLTPKFSKVLIGSLNECLDIFELTKTEISKDYLDASYNLSNLTMAYYKALKINQSEIDKDMVGLIKKLKKSLLLEVRNTWIDVNIGGETIRTQIKA